MAYEAYNAMRQMNNLTSPQSYFQQQNQSILNAKFDQGINVYQVYFNASSTPTNVRIVDNDTDTQEQKTIFVKDTNLNFGDIVSWNGVNWLVELVDLRYGIRKRGTMRRCVSSLVWLDNTSATPTKTAPFYLVTDTQRGLGVNDGRLMLLPDERRYVALQNNADTLKIVKGQRFILDNNRAWKVYSVNTLLPGIIHLELQEDEVKATDNISLRIADYTTVTIPPTQPDGSKTLI